LLLTHNRISQGCLYNKFSVACSFWPSVVGYQPMGQWDILVIARPSASAYISGKSKVPVLLLLLNKAN